MKNMLIGLSCLVVFFLSIRWLLPDLKETPCVLKRDFVGHSYIGIVKKKYVDTKQHSYPIVEILNQKDSILKLNLVLEKNRIYNKISEGAYLYKLEGADSVFIMKGDKKIFIGKASYGCND